MFLPLAYHSYFEEMNKELCSATQPRFYAEIRAPAFERYTGLEEGPWQLLSHVNLHMWETTSDGEPVIWRHYVTDLLCYICP